MTHLQNDDGKPLVAMTTRRDVQEDTHVQIRSKYLHAVIKAGGIPVLLPPHLPEEDFPGIVFRFDGLILSGGEDVDPAWYREARHPRLGTVDALRDRFELGLTKMWLESGKPLLGICRGIQVLNVAAGGTLIQDIGSERDHFLTHRPGGRRNALAHEVKVFPDSCLFRNLGLEGAEAKSIMVNSIHHQSVAKVASGFRVAACSPDGVVEAIECVENPQVWAVQWHPEELSDAEAAGQMVFQTFIAQCAASLTL